MTSVHQFLLFLGIDIAKESFVAWLTDANGSKLRTRKFTNDDAGVAELILWLNADGRPCRAIIEATSRYHRLCERGLLSAGVLVELVNPRRARALAQGLGYLDKDDKVDAQALADAARLLQARDEKVASIQAQDLKDHSRTIDTIKRDAAKFIQRMDGLDPDSDAYKACAKAVKALKDVAAQEERIWQKAVQAETEIYRRYKLAKSVPDVGHVTARTVSVELPADLDKAARKIIAYSGTVPRRHQSGNEEMPPQIYGGNPRLRTGLFMAAMHSVYFGKRNLTWYEILKSRPNVCVKTKGGRHLKAIVAVMRKILANIIAVIKRDSPWTQQPPTYPKPNAVPATEPYLT
jgi:transposase